MLSEGGVNQRSSAAEKIRLFRSFFRGREDLFPKRFESKRTKKSGYLPVCTNAWIRGVCEKPKIKCADCRFRRFLSVSDEVVKWHLSGQDDCGKDFVMGVYPLLRDETCFFLAVDFDKGSFEKDVVAFTTTCQKLNVPAVVERSRSGKGAHVWIFFSEAVPSALARKLGSHILTETMERYPEIGLDSYDRFFPNQDTLPQGGFGNLIALPLQKKVREAGNSVFVNESFVAHQDQWAFLSTVQKVSPSDVAKLVHHAERKGRITGVHRSVYEEDDLLPWRKTSVSSMALPPTDAPESVDVVYSNEIFIKKENLPPWLKNRLLRLATFQNPEFYKAQAMRLSTHEKPRFISCAVDYPEHLGLPRGCYEDVCQLFSELKISCEVKKELQKGRPLEATFRGELRPEQQMVAKTLLKTNIGVLSATTAFGKTVLASYLISKRKVNVLVLVHRKQLQEQWVERLSTFLDVPKSTIGRIGGGVKKKSTGLIDVAVIQSLVRKGVVSDIVRDYGFLIVDECHHIPAFSFEQIMREAKAQYITGLTATVTRKDGHHPIMTMRCGAVRYRVDAKAHVACHPFEHTVFVRPTAFSPKKPAHEDTRMRFHELYEELIRDEERNRLICADVLRALEVGRSPIVLTERTKHLDYFVERLSPHVQHTVVFRGGMSSKSLHEAATRLTNIPENESRLLIATGQFVGEGFDDARLDTLFLTLPVSWKGTIAQYVGRLHRLYEEKHEVQVYDYADINVPMLERMFNRRCHSYETIGYKILLPGSALPGWPSQIPLPVDPAWKEDYAASVRRLIRDGVDVPLGSLFANLATQFPEDAEGEHRSRSATESFLFRRLDTLSETAGRFKLNVKLPISFDGWGEMEVDFLCADAHLVIEIDGEQHLDDRDAYRRDRRKDALLQENGYFVLRFLAEDVGKRLDDVLDAILRVLVKRL